MEKFGVNKVPLVSVILTSYNQEKYLKESIESVLHQTFQDFELIIVDDCSSDDSWDIIQSYSNNIKVKTVRSQKNSGGFFCWEFMRGGGNAKYLAMHHSDDVWELTKLEKQVAYLEAHPEYAACFTLVEFIDEDSKHYELPEGHVYKGVFDKENKSKEEWLNYFFYKGNCLCHPSVLIRKEMYEKYGLLDTFGMAQIPDFLMWVKLCLDEEIFIYQEKLTKFRLRRGEQENTSADKPEVRVRSQFEILNLLKEFLKITNKEMFLKTFPEANAFVCNNSINLEFALAKLCLNNNRPYMLFALEILFSLINNKEKSIELEHLYHYTYKDFIIDSAQYDIFGIKEDFRYLETSIFVDYGDGFSAENRFLKKIYLPQSGQFCFECIVSGEKNGRTIKRLRFDPSEGEAIKVSFLSFKINGKAISYQPINNVATDGMYDIFISGDPQYIIDVVSDIDLRIIISGSIKILDYIERDRIINCLLEEKNNMYDAVVNSTSWKVTKILRVLKRIIKR